MIKHKENIKRKDVFNIFLEKILVVMIELLSMEVGFMISTRGRYAIRVMLDLAINQGDGYVPMKNVADRQNLSLKYLEQILPILSKNKMIEGLQGKGGGYRLTKDPSEYVIGNILRLTEKDLAPVSCLSEGAPICERRAECRTIGFWEGLNDIVNEYIDSKTLADLI